jgi:flagellar protein FliO/FliZ
MPAVYFLIVLLAAAPPASARGGKAKATADERSRLTEPATAAPPSSPEAVKPTSGPSIEDDGSPVKSGGERDAPVPAKTDPSPAAVADPPAAPVPTVAATAAVATPIPATAAPPIVADAALASATEGSLWWRVLPPALVLALLGGVALALTRKRRSQSAPLELVGSLSLGPKRQLVVARYGADELLLGSSEAGIQLLVRRPLAPAAAHGADDAWLTSLATEETAATAPAADADVDYPMAAAAEVASPGAHFEAVLDDSVEDQALRRKLAAGLRGGRS